MISQAALLSTWGRNTWLGRSAEMDAGLKEVSKIVNRSDWFKSISIGICEQEWGLWTGRTADAGIAEALVLVMSSLGCYSSKKKKRHEWLWDNTRRCKHLKRFKTVPHQEGLKGSEIALSIGKKYNLAETYLRDIKRHFERWEAKPSHPWQLYLSGHEFSTQCLTRVPVSSAGAGPGNWLKISSFESSLTTA